MKITDLTTGMLVKDGTKLLQVSTVSVYENYVRLQVLLEGRPAAAPRRTSVRTYAADEFEMFCSPASPGQLRRLAEVYGR